MNKLVVDIGIKAAIFWCKEDFETEEEWILFVNRMKSDLKFARDKTLEIILDGSVSDLIGFDGRRITRFIVREEEVEH